MVTILASNSIHFYVWKFVPIHISMLIVQLFIYVFIYLVIQLLYHEISSPKKKRSNFSINHYFHSKLKSNHKLKMVGLGRMNEYKVSSIVFHLTKILAQNSFNPFQVKKDGKVFFHIFFFFFSKFFFFFNIIFMSKFLMSSAPICISFLYFLNSI